MKRCIVILLALMLLAACGAKEQVPAMEPKDQSSSISKPAPAPDPTPSPLPDLLPGRVLALGDALLEFTGENKAATQTELKRWQTAVNDPAIVRLDFNNMDKNEKDLSVEEEQDILAALRSAQLRLYDALPNPSTGGGRAVIAYDDKENILFHAVYMGDWFCVKFGSENAIYVFDGEGTTLDALGRSDYGVSETPAAPQQAPDTEPELQPTPGTGRILAMGDPLLDFGGERKAATQYELDLWESYINEPVLTRIDFSNMHDTGRELSAQEEKQILAALWNAELRLYDALPNPSTGGGCHVIAYDGRDNIMFHAVFMGDWFCVKFVDENVQYVFDGEGTTLNDLFGIA